MAPSHNVRACTRAISRLSSPRKWGPIAPHTLPLEWVPTFAGTATSRAKLARRENNDPSWTESCFASRAGAASDGARRRAGAVRHQGLVRPGLSHRDDVAGYHRHQEGLL